jgi:hypothetical protein
MAEAEWLECPNYRVMRKHLRKMASDRKVRLFACACCRRAWDHIWFASERKAVESAEQYADGAVDVGVLAAALGAAIEEGTGKDWGRAHVAACWSANQRRSTVEQVASKLATELAVHAAKARSGKRWNAAKKFELSAQASLLRDILSNPFRPVMLNPTWLTRTVTSLARAAYEDRRLPSGELDPARLAVLADALEEAGCDNADLLNHCRGPGPHIRGCWAVDLILDKS